MSKSSRILLVDDSPAILALLRDMLKFYGYANVETATSIEEGLKLFGEHKPDLVFLDLMMPDSSGIEFTRKALAENPASRIILTTALSQTHEAVVMAISQGAADYLQKPIRRDNLAYVLDHIEREDRPAPHDPTYR